MLMPPPLPSSGWLATLRLNCGYKLSIAVGSALAIPLFALCPRVVRAPLAALTSIRTASQLPPIAIAPTSRESGAVAKVKKRYASFLTFTAAI